MSTLSSPSPNADSFFSLFQYREVSEPEAVNESDREAEGNPTTIPPAQSLAEVEKLVETARADARKDAEEQVRTELEEEFTQQRERLRASLSQFQAERARYFAKAEGEIVHLALAIAAKILHRESQVDPFLLRAMVKVSLEKLQGEATVHLRVATGDVPSWQKYVDESLKTEQVNVVADDEIPAGGCLLATEMGEMEFSIEAQVKDIEKAFFDLLAQRPIPE